MKNSYKQKLFLYFVLIFTLFTGIVILFEQSREKGYKTKALEEKLETYADMVHTALLKYSGRASALDSLNVLFPLPVRLTWIDEQGVVLYDNVIKDISTMENHADRPEIINAREGKGGSDIRTSFSNEQKYLYYAKQFDHYYVRVALPYDIETRRFLKADNLFLYYIAALFIVMLWIINYIVGKSGSSIEKKIAQEQEKTRLLKQEMTGNITHELRTPVTGIRGCLETILEHQLDPKTERHFIENAYNQIVVLSELIQDMSLITKIEDAPQSFQIESIKMNELLDDLKVDLEKSLQEKNIGMDWHFANEVVVKGNRNLIYSIFRNLTDNVIRHAGNNVNILINKYKEDKNFYYFSYSDTGVGIPDEHHLSRLFERFYRVNEGRTRDTGGSGLGLSIVKNAIAFHKGTISVKNRTGGGLEFLFKLPKVSGVFYRT